MKIDDFFYYKKQIMNVYLELSFFRESKVYQSSGFYSSFVLENIWCYSKFKLNLK